MRVLFRLQDLEQGVLPQVKEIVVTPSITNNDMQRAVSSLVKLDDIKKDKKAKKHKKSKSLYCLFQSSAVAQFVEIVRKFLSYNSNKDCNKSYSSWDKIMKIWGRYKAFCKWYPFMVQLVKFHSCNQFLIWLDIQVKDLSKLAISSLLCVICVHLFHVLIAQTSHRISITWSQCTGKPSTKNFTSTWHDC